MIFKFAQRKFRTVRVTLMIVRDFASFEPARMIVPRGAFAPSSARRNRPGAEFATRKIFSSIVTVAFAGGVKKPSPVRNATTTARPFPGRTKSAAVSPAQLTRDKV